MSDIDLKKRAKWAIVYIIKKEHLSNIKLGQKMGFAAGTINSYRRMTTVPSAEFMEIFCQQFEFNQAWFLSGIGEPFPGAFAKYPEVCGSAGSAPEVREPVPPYGALVAEQKINIEEAVGKAYKILSSGTAVAAALYLNIQQFAVGLDTSRELKECKDQLAAQQREIDELKRKMERLEAVPAGAAEVGDSTGKKAM